MTRPTLLEEHTGLPVGRRSGPPTPLPPWGAVPHGAARAELEAVVADVLEAGPCVVQFSGGRDSSLILAVAVHVARERGFDVPDAVTVRYPGVAAADEAQWQDLVVAHLGIPLQVVEVPLGGDDVVGRLGTDMLRAHGVTVPAPMGVNLGRMLPVARGATLLTGEGGDEVLGPQRISVWVGSWRRREVPSAARARVMAVGALPAPARRAVLLRRGRSAPVVPWVREPVAELVRRRLAQEWAAEPWDWRAATWRPLDSRQLELGAAAEALLTASEGFRVCHPLRDRRFVTALCREAGPWGWVTRTDVMRLLAADLLPAAVLGRTSKATFNGVYAGERTRAFARAWDGSGLDPDLADVSVLRSVLLAETVPAQALVPLQRAALAFGWDG